MRRTLLPLTLLCMVAALGAAQSPFRALPAAAQFRDVAVARNAARIYAAAYDNDAVWVFDAVSGERRDTITVGKGPAALAISADGKTLACVNRLDNTVSLIRDGVHEPYAALVCGKGPTAIAATPDGQFLVADTFGDALSLVYPDGSGSVSTLASPCAVPVDVAAADGVYAVIGRTEKAVFLCGRDGGTPQRVALDALPRKVIALLGKQFAVATPEAVVVVDADAGKIAARRAVSVEALAPAAGGMVAVASGKAQWFDAALKPLASETLDYPAMRIAAVGRVCVAVSPTQKEWRVSNQGGVSAPVEIPAPIAEEAAAAPVQAPTPAVEEAVAAPAETPAPAVEEAAAAPAETPTPIVEEAAAAPAETPTPVVEEAAAAPAEPPMPVVEEVAAAPVETPAPAAAEEKPSMPETPVPAAAPEEPVQVKYIQMPIVARGVYAPSTGSQPTVDPFATATRRTIADALTQPTEFGAFTAGFQEPDWTEPMRDAQADSFKRNLETGENVLSGNVKLSLGEMQFHANEFSYSDGAGEYHASGDVTMTQEASTFTADDVRYVVPSIAELPAPNPLEPVLSEQDRAKQRLTLGHLYAKNANIEEPTRYLKAGDIAYNFADGSGTLENANGCAGIYYFHADRLTIQDRDNFVAENVWLTTCNHESPHYRIRLKSLEVKDGVAVYGTNARLQLGKADTPLFLPSWRQNERGGSPWNLDFDSGRRANIGYFTNLGYRFEVTPDLAIGPRIMPTSKEGVGVGFDMDYDYTKNPASRLYLSKGEVHGLQTTEDRGYLHFYHRWEYDEDLVIRMQAEQWSDEDFYKDFFYQEYRNRTEPRTFGNVTYRQPGYIATGTLRLNTHAWEAETERMPEATFHLLERQLAPNLYVAFDTVDGYNDRNPGNDHGMRTANVGRVTYDVNLHEALSLNAFWEPEFTWYSDIHEGDEAASRFSNTLGVTAQTRLHRAYGPALGFSGFKHIILPSVTYSYRPSPSLAVGDTPYFDAMDNVYGRTRLESKIDNVLYGQDAATKMVWQVGRLTLYQGNDFWNEQRQADDYELEMDIRPRPWWGFQLAGERHDIQGDYKLDESYNWRMYALGLYEDVFDRTYLGSWANELNGTYSDYSRVLTQLYYDDTPLNGNLNARVGFAYTETGSQVFNREVLYGLGYKLNDKWSVSFEHRYDFERNDLHSQIYEVRRSLHCWEALIRVRERESGTDVDFAFNIKAFPGTRLKF